MSQVFEKHKKYKDKYGRMERFWGLGIEEETYFQFTKPLHVAAPICRTAHKPERYSVDYYKTFKEGYRKDIDVYFTDIQGFYDLPFFFNSHSFSKIDTSGNHALTYEKVPKPNRKYQGKSFFEKLQAWDPAVFTNEYERSFTFDGDTVEFITQDFYQTRIDDVILELTSHKERFLNSMNRYLVAQKIHREKGLFMYPPRNPGFAVFHSNPANVLMFNNGTYHINITLPTILDNDSQILLPQLFRKQHQSMIRLIQWLEPLLIAAYGTPDPLSQISSRYAKGSQRCAISRYIGVGTFDSETMPEGKMLQVERAKHPLETNPVWWYTRYHKGSAYLPLDRIGLDINYKKHYNHGIEIRFFDWFPADRLRDLLELIVYLGEHSYIGEIQACSVLESWNDTVLGVFQEGPQHRLSMAALASYEKIFRCELLGNAHTALDALSIITKSLKSRYRHSWLAKLFIHGGDESFCETCV